MRKVAEIVLVLSAMAGMRGGGRSPTEAELELMGEARAKLVNICEGFAPKDLVAKDAVSTVIEDLGLNWKAKDQRLGFRGSRLSIKEKFSLAKRKMDDSKKLPPPASTYTPSLGHTHTIRMISSDKPNNAALPSGGITGSSVPSTPLVHNPPAATPGAVTYQPHATGSTGLPGGQLGRDSSASPFPRIDKAKPKIEGGTNGTTYGPQLQANHSLVNTPTWPLQPHSTSSVKVAPENKVPNHNSLKVEGTSDSGSMQRPSSQATRDQIFRPVVTQTAPTSLPSIHPMQNMKFVHPSSFLNNHGEIAKIVQKLLQSKLPERPTWTPPSREYMNKAFACQMCKLTVIEVETVVLCDACEKGYHLKCLEAINHKGIPRGEWHCSKCTALSNGKPLPPKYGRVMRSVTTPPKGTPNTAAAQSSSDRKIGTTDPKVNQEKITNKTSSLQNAGGFDALRSKSMYSGLDSKIPKEKETAENIASCAKYEQGTSSGTLSINSIERSTQQTQASASCTGEERSASALEPPAVISDKVDKNVNSNPLQNQQAIVKSDAPNSGEVPVRTCQDHSVVEESQVLRENNDIESRLDAKKNEQHVVPANPVGKSEASDSSGGHASLASNGLRDVEWVGNALKVVDGKKFYETCRVDDSTYKVLDHALFNSSRDKLIPSKLQAMWEDIKTGSKWVLVNQCYFPDGLPKAVGHPCGPESNEVYESNHEISVLAGLILGPCEVLPPTRFKEKSERQSHSGTEANNGSAPVFLCKWFYDEPKGTFHPVFG